MDLHINAYCLNHWLLSLYDLRHLHYSVPLLSRGETHFPVFAQILIYVVFCTRPAGCGLALELQPHVFEALKMQRWEEAETLPCRDDKLDGRPCQND